MELDSVEEEYFVYMVRRLKPGEGRKSYKMTKANYLALCAIFKEGIECPK